MKPPEFIETSRLILRLPQMADAGAIFTGYAQDLEVVKYLTWRPHPDIETTRAFLQRCIQGWESGSAFPWVIVLKENQKLVGMIEMHINDYRADLGYGLARSFWGRGFATEAVKAIVDWALAQASIFRVWAVCDVENLASARVLEKAGLQREGLLRRYILHPNISREPRDVYCYAKVK
jgi:ribosomal-protein-alanine N-acetyltransferase